MQLDRRAVLGLGGVGLAAVVLGTGTSGAEARYPFQLSDAEWRRRLSPEAYRILRKAGTERPGSSSLDHERRRGTFVCAGCGNPLFSSADKFDSGTGWPSFTRALPRRAVTRPDRSIPVMPRTECLCARCGGHLGHVFDDGPRPTGHRWCINGVALRFTPAQG
ncbi:peptide-methionine (R)-S-oxide reductase MsrB [Sphingomonas arenae]|uniref:peptide-methionine (R)-S-oxide reductase MsrB n=1 Tax=Sphingomonas arenae TaxID=2812555 RepID=UPI00196700EC|nr:peptide-methionine (R)-S-oxide reductase MsrB [Sphingomonas arenae]